MTDRPTDNPIAAKVREIDAECPCHFMDQDYCGEEYEVRCECCLTDREGRECVWDGHRLVRELAKVAQERMREQCRATYKQMNREGWWVHIEKEIAALLLEGCDD